MKKIWNKIKENIFLYVAIYILIFIVAYFMLGLLGLTFRQWFYIFSFILVVIGTIFGIFVQILKLKEKYKKVVLSIVVTIACLLASPFVILFCAFAYKPEHVVEKKGQKMVANVNAFLDTCVYYYEYKNFLVVGTNKVMEEYYGDGGFDPIENKFGYEYIAQSVTYYDEAGNVIETESHKNTTSDEEKYTKKDTGNSNANVMENLQSDVGYKNGKLYINCYSSNPKEVPIEMDNIEQYFTEKQRFQTLTDKYIFAYDTDNAINIVYTNDKGNTWKSSKIEMIGSVYYLKFVDENNGFIVAFTENVAMRDVETQIYNTIDGGASWKLASTQNMKIDSEVEFTNEKVGYYTKNDECYATIDAGVTFTKIISAEQAADIADKEAMNSKYQYQSWESEFYARGKNNTYEICSTLMLGLDEVNKIYTWQEKWASSAYNGQLMWQIRLFDENDPLTSLYIYVDAKNGDVLGAGSMSD